MEEDTPSNPEGWSPQGDRLFGHRHGLGRLGLLHTADPTNYEVSHFLPPKGSCLLQKQEDGQDQRHCHFGLEY